MLVCERVVDQDGKSRSVKNREIEEISDLGIVIKKIPAPLSINLNDIKRTFFNDHLDRIGALISDTHNNLHLVLDPGLMTTKWTPGQTRLWDLMNPAESIDKIKSICEPHEIEVHTPKALRVPYSLNLMQFVDGQILMTSGDGDVAEVIANIVGSENVHLTPIPIRYYPTWLYAGIRCLINDAPLPVLKPA